MSRNIRKINSNNYDKKRQKEFEKQRHELGMKYAKSTFIRYMSALLFVGSIYWFFLSLLTKPILSILPAIYFFAYLICMVDSYMSLHNHKQEIFNWTNKVMKITIITDLILIIIAIFDYKMLFPYFKEFYIPVICFLIAIIIKILIIKKIEKYNKN